MQLISTSPQRRLLNSGIFRIENGEPFRPNTINQHALVPNSRPSIMSGVRAGRSRTNPLQHEVMIAAEYGANGNENEPLLRRQPKRRPRDMASSIVLCAAVSLWVLVIGFVCVMYWTLSGSVAVAQEAAAPYIVSIMNHTISILRNVDASSFGAADVVNGARSVSSTAVPALQSALNQTAIMLARLEKLAEHPVLRVSLGNQ